MLHYLHHGNTATAVTVMVSIKSQNQIHQVEKCKNLDIAIWKEN